MVQLKSKMRSSPNKRWVLTTKAEFRPDMEKIEALLTNETEAR